MWPTWMFMDIIIAPIKVHRTIIKPDIVYKNDSRNTKGGFHAVVLV